MAIEEIANSPTEVATELATALGSIGLWLKALGLVVVIWIVIQIINWFISHKKLQTLYSMKEDLVRIEKKINRLNKK